MKSRDTVVATVVYLITNNTICLAQKKQPIHKKNGEVLKQSKMTWNGYGGKREKEDASVRDTAIRELFDESGVIAYPENLIPAGKLNFFWEGNISKVSDMSVYFFFCGTWQGKPVESAEMGEPVFFALDAIPYDAMMPNDRNFLPKMLDNEKVIADVFFIQKDGKREVVSHTLDEELVV